MKVYRGTRDIFPNKINHKKISSGVYGSASYYALNYSDAKMYSGGGFGNCAVICTYEIFLKNILEINPSEYEIRTIADAKKPRSLTPKLQESLDYQNPQLPPILLSKVAQQSGFDSIWLKGMVEGGEQIIIPEGIDFSLELTNLDIQLSKSLLGQTKNDSHLEEFKTIFRNEGINISETEYYLYFSLNSFQLKKIEPILEFIQYSIKGRNLLKINFSNLTYELYDGDE